MTGKINKRIAELRMIALIAMALTPSAALAQEHFSTPKQAVDALVAANRSGNKTELLNLLGPRADKLISSGDAVADKDSREKFLAAYDTAHKLEKNGDDAEVLIVGEQQWPLPIPLVRHNATWRFDADAGAQEILNRRIGRNELNVIEVCRAYVEAQLEYAEQHPLDNGKHEYAQHFLSHNGEHDGLYWPTAADEKESPLGPLVASAQAEGYNFKAGHAKHQPYHGYFYKILTGQSKNTRGGAMNYISAGHMTGGFALLAFPARYGDSGIMTFIVNGNGIVHEKDLGPHTPKIAAGIKRYGPDESWKLAEESEQDSVAAPVQK